MAVPNTSEQAKGRWPAILGALGVGRDCLTGKHGPCPICREGKDRFRFDDKDGRGTWFCNSCGAGDGFQLLEKLKGWSFQEAAREVEKHVGTAPVSIKPERTEAEQRDAKNRLWRLAKPLGLETPAGLYLRNRLGVDYPAQDIRWAAKVAYHQRDEKPTYHPCMVAMVRDKDGAPVNLHRTYISDSGWKAGVPDPKRVMEGDLPAGCAIRLTPSAERMGIAEGIETALAASLQFGVPVWAAINDSRLAAWVPPPITKTVLIFGDNDRSFAGQSAAFALAKRLRREKFEVNVHLPDIVGLDWDDVWRRKQAAEAEALKEQFAA